MNVNTTRVLPLFFLASSSWIAGCTPSGGQAMPMAATPAGQSNQPDVREPTARDPNLHVNHAAGDSDATAAMPQGEGTNTDDMAAEMKDLGDRMSAMGLKMQSSSAAMKADGKMVKGKQPAGAAMDDMDAAKMKAIGVQMKEMGAKMRSRGQAMKGDQAATNPKPATGGMTGMPPGKMMEMGDQMMAMGSQMMDMGGDTGAAPAAKMKQMGDHMMEMGGGMGGMGKPKGGAMKKPMAPPAAAPPAAPPAPAAAPMPPMQDM